MIAFATLFLGLVIGVAPVRLLVQGPVAAVEIQLDGQVVGRVEQTPWTLPVDFGTELSPHELLARALDRKGQELARVRQWLNLPRPAAEVEIVIEPGDRDRPAAARLTWQSLIRETPTRVTVTFDGKPLPLLGSNRVLLPSYDPEARHLLSAEVEFSPVVRSRKDVVLGGRAAVVHNELTAVAVKSLGRIGPLTTKGMQAWFWKKGEPLSIVATEHTPALVCFVRDLDFGEAAKKLGTGGKTLFVPRGRGVLPQHDRDALRFEMTFGKEDRVRFVWPIARAAEAGSPSELFDASHDFTDRDGGIHWLLTRVYHPARGTPEPRFADAVAVAGLQAMASYSRRAVVMVVGHRSPDASRHAPAMVRRYLERIRVPLHVWSLEGTPSSSSDWGPTEDISSLSKLRGAVDRLRQELETQEIVWLEGTHLPQQIALSDQAKGIELLR